MTCYNRLLSLALVLISGFLLGMLGYSLWGKTPPILQSVNWSSDTQWITSSLPSYSFYARRIFYLEDRVDGAWLRLSADNDFQIYVNGKSVAKEYSYLLKEVKLHKLGGSEQNPSNSLAYFSRSTITALANPRDWKLTSYIDLTHYLNPGKNVIAISIQKSQPNPRFALEGIIYPVQEGQPISLTTGKTRWLTSSLAENHQELRWFDVDFPDQGWSNAQSIGPVIEKTYSRIDEQIFDRFLEGEWITGTESSLGEVWLRGHWKIPQKTRRAFIRFAGTGEYALMLNGKLVQTYQNEAGQKLHIYEVTNFLHSGLNILAVRLARPLTTSKTLPPLQPLSFFLDGWVQTNQGILTSAIASNNYWQSLTKPVLGWTENLGKGQPIVNLRLPNPQEFQRIFDGDAYLLNYPNHLGDESLWRLGGMGLTLLFTLIMGRLWLGYSNSWWDSLGAGTGLLFPSTLFLIGIGLIKHRYAEEELEFLFLQSNSIPLICLGFMGITLLTLIWTGRQLKKNNQHNSLINISVIYWSLWACLGLISILILNLVNIRVIFSQYPLTFILILSGILFLSLILLNCSINRTVNNRLQVWQSIWSRWGHWIILSIIVVIGFSLRAYKLNELVVFPDEATSLDTVRGILKTGAPILTSKIWYTRSPVYHYMLALWLSLFGNSIASARFLTVVWGTLTIIVIFFFTRKITGKVFLALIVASILAIDPWAIGFSRIIRFYQIVQCLSLVSFYFFFKGFIDKEGKKYQIAFFVFFTLTLLNQEVIILLFPCFLLGFLFFYRSFSLRRDGSIILGSVMTLIIFAYNFLLFKFRCITPFIAKNTMTGSITQFHLWNITEFSTNFFVGQTRMYIIYSFFFLLGFIYFLIRKDGKIVFLFTCLFLNLIFLSVIVMETRNRYFYSTHTLFIFLTAYSAFCLMKDLGQRCEIFSGGIIPLKKIALFFLILLFLSSFQLKPTLASYQDSLGDRQYDIFKYIQHHRLSGDVVITYAAQVPAITLSGLDYFLSHTGGPQPRFDAIYSHNSQIIDRWSGGIIIPNIDQMSQVLNKVERVWIVIPTYDPSIAPITRDLESYLQILGQPILETYRFRLRLWQRADGLLPRVPNQGQDLGIH
jgi:hypothetical protein